MRYTLLTLAFLFLAGCVSTSSTVSDEVASEIPDGATAVVVTSTSSPGTLYEKLYQNLTTQGYPIQDSNNEMRTVTTGFKEVGQETTLSVNATVQQYENGARAVLRGQWGVTGSMAAGLSSATGGLVGKNVGETAEWKPRNRAGVAFGALASFSQRLPHNGIEYRK
jgi:hypothetical protein